MTIKTPWLGVVASALLLLACFNLLVPPMLLSRSFQDENASVQVGVNFFSHLQYALLLERPHFDAFHAEMSIGLLSNWPGALGWGFGGNMLWARIAVTAYCLALTVALGAAFTRTVLPALRPVSVPLSLASCLVALMLVPGTPRVIVQVLGEYSAGIFLAFGFLLLEAHPRAAALVLGLCIWHTKFVYVPFALAGVVASAVRNETMLGRRARFLAVQLGMLMLPLVLWLVLVWIRTGTDGLAEWLQRRLHFYRYMHYAKLDRPLPVTGLGARLASLEWARYTWTTKAEVLALLAAPCAVLLGQTYGRWRDGVRDRSLDTFQLGFCAAFLMFAWWYFLLHQYMWLRHLVPALLVGFGVLLYFALTRAARLAPRRQAWLAGLVCLALAIETILTAPATVRLIQVESRRPIFALTCRADTPWALGPWSRVNCWTPRLEQHRVDLVGD